MATEGEGPAEGLPDRDVSLTTSSFASQIGDEASHDSGAADEPEIVVHCSDLHFGSGFLPKRAEDLLQSIQQIRPNLAVISGDLTMRARTEQFKAARAFLQQIPAPLIAIPGNHDVPLYNLWERLTHPFENYNRYIAPLNSGPVRLQHVSFFGMNTVNPHRHQQGKFRLLEMMEMESWASQQSDCWRVAVIHQHFANVPHHERPGTFRRGEAALKRFSGAGVHAILHGHVHYQHVASSAEFFPSVEPPVVLVSAGTPTSLRTRGARPTNNFNVLKFRRDSFEVQQWDWVAERQGFAAERQVKFDKRFFER